MSASWLRILCFLAAGYLQPVKLQRTRQAAKNTLEALPTRFDTLHASCFLLPTSRFRGGSPAIAAIARKSQATTFQDRARNDRASAPSSLNPRSAKAYPPAQDSVNARISTALREPTASDPSPTSNPHLDRRALSRSPPPSARTSCYSVDNSSEDDPRSIGTVRVIPR
jgi:hypothetical protein